MSPCDFDQGQLAAGTLVEMEHTGDFWVAREIAMDHLAESPDYYRELSKMERKLRINAAGHYVLIQEPRREPVYVRCRNIDQCLAVVEDEIHQNLPGTRITAFRKERGEGAEILAIWHVGSRGVKRYHVNGDMTIERPTAR